MGKGEYNHIISVPLLTVLEATNPPDILVPAGYACLGKIIKYCLDKPLLRYTLCHVHVVCFLPTSSHNYLNFARKSGKEIILKCPFKSLLQINIINPLLNLRVMVKVGQNLRHFFPLWW